MRWVTAGSFFVLAAPFVVSIVEESKIIHNNDCNDGSRGKKFHIAVLVSGVVSTFITLVAFIAGVISDIRRARTEARWQKIGYTEAYTGPLEDMLAAFCTTTTYLFLYFVHLFLKVGKELVQDCPGVDRRFSVPFMIAGGIVVVTFTLGAVLYSWWQKRHKKPTTDEFE